MAGQGNILRFQAVNRERAAKREAEQEKVLLAYRASPDGLIRPVLKECGITWTQYRGWRDDHPMFRHKMNQIKAEITGKPYTEQNKIYPGGFAAFRKHFFGHDTPEFQLAMLTEIEQCAPGKIVLILTPPEHGKTTLLEDWFTYKLCIDPSYRIICVSEGQGHARKMLSRVKHRLESSGPFPKMVIDFGPFEPQSGESKQPWSADYFSVFKKGGFDDRDYSLNTLGWRSAIAGSRTDHLHIDDIQSKRSLSMTGEMLEVFRQDMLSRPGTRGITTLTGTRVGEEDFYQALIENLDPKDFSVVMFPAIIHDGHTGETRPLWPKENPDDPESPGYTLEDMASMRRKVGEVAWSRNYMQNPKALGGETFDEKTTDKAKDPLLSARAPIDPGDVCWITVDPALGGKNCVMTVIPGRRFRVCRIVEDMGLTKNEEIMDRIKESVMFVMAHGGVVTEVIIETMNFQKGLANDERLTEYAATYGFNIQPHLTGHNKIDESIGIPSMATTFRKGEFQFPWADDEESRWTSGELIRQLGAWKQGKSGKVLRQDQVMCLWFGWLKWLEMSKGEDTENQEIEGVQMAGLPWAPTNSGLIVPVGATV